MGRVEAIVIAGPTASGKSALALKLALATGGSVVNADSMQVYADLRVLTARPRPEDEAQAPHLLYGHVDGATNYSVGHYAAEAADVLDDLRARGVLPIVVGGTGLYLASLIEGLSDLPPVPSNVRASVRAAAEGRSSADLHAELAARDPDAAERLRPSDRLRVLRALEVHFATSRSITSFRTERRPGPLAGRDLATIFLAPDRTLVRQRIDERFHAMVTAGALEEVAALGSRGLDRALPAMRAHGVPGLLAYLSGECSLEEAVARGQADTRRYVKRQFTWARHRLPGFAWTAPEDAEAILRSRILA